MFLFLETKRYNINTVDFIHVQLKFIAAKLILQTINKLRYRYVESI